jgi:hypothetical protein
MAGANTRYQGLDQPMELAALSELAQPVNSTTPGGCQTRLPDKDDTMVEVSVLQWRRSYNSWSVSARYDE